ncbi:polysaccharide biosynthesis protein [Paraglaciecola aquimarina]|uniref:Polysaccharide biosynthesis protein n=1 Tax=Paraglaciecola algarum TaxID=3050085 RepID=A0ABS9D6L1_9ALTE|nr:polysaccharide biosynthesis protein [Paraglaciecola sp. G1-23]MCF2947678.1 polysaccharide biosynthesis protein [Paraglaciecola sp. G1-23]
MFWGGLTWYSFNLASKQKNNKEVSKSIAKNTVLTLVANISLAASNWLILVIIAKQFSDHLLGLFVFALSICSPAFLFASFKIRTLLVVDTKWQFRFEDYATARLLSNAFVTLVLISAVLVNLIHLPLYVLALVIIYKLCDAWSEFCQSYMRRVFNYRAASISLTSRSGLTMILVLAFSVLSDSFEVLLLVWCVTAVVFALIDNFLMLQLTKKHETTTFNYALLIDRQAFSNAFKLYRKYLTVACALAISSLFVYLPNLLLSYQLGLQAAGQFAAISYFLVAGGILVNSVSQASTPNLARLLKNDNYPDFIQLVKKMCLVGLCIGFAGLITSFLLGEYFLKLFYTAEIASHYPTLNWVMLAAAVRYIYIFLGTSLAAVQQFHIQTKIYSVGLVTMFFSGFLLIEKHGLVGAAQAMLIATLVELLLFSLLSKKYWHLAFDKNKEAP